MYYLEKFGNSKKNQKMENQHGVMICNVLPRKNTKHGIPTV
jgi:hypothetical protein